MCFSNESTGKTVVFLVSLFFCGGGGSLKVGSGVLWLVTDTE